jgi:hypothetical protein
MFALTKVLVINYALVQDEISGFSNTKDHAEGMQAKRIF